MKVAKRKFVLATTLGSLVALVGIILATSANFIFDLLLRTQMALGPNSASYPLWAELTVPIKTSMYLFNVTNPQGFLKNGEKPILVEIGPYVFDEFHKKTDLVWNANGTVTYKQIRTFHFNPEESRGKLSDSVTVLNIPAATIGATAEKQNTVVRGLMNGALLALGEKLFVTTTAKEILFDGYEDPILKAAKFIHDFNVPIPGFMDKFGFYYGRNESSWWDGVFNMHTGHNNIHHLGEITNWNYSSNPGYFPGKCGQVRGVGDLFPPYMPDESVAFFSNDLCRAIDLAYDDWEYVKGVPGKRYRIDSTYFANSSVNRNNECFEQGPSPLPSGVYNASSCRFGAPIFMSQPHFYQGDGFYLDGVASGSLVPSKEKHETVFVIESQSGVPIAVTARFQVNALVDKLDEITMFANVPKRTFFPVVWFESKFLLAETLIVKVWFLSHLHLIMVTLGLLMGAVGLSTAIAFGACYSAEKRRGVSSQPYQPIVDTDNPEPESEPENH